MDSDEYEIDTLLDTWEEIYKRGLLSFWLLLLLHERPVYAYEMKTAISDLSGGTIIANDNSIYRALTRFENLGLLEGRLHESKTGPSRKYYHLTPTGLRLLAAFIQRNLLILQTPSTVERMQAVLSAAQKETNP